jgi:tRNA (cytidine32/uridine32-2'-O)-methyltransferase
MSKLRRLFNRARPEAVELNILRGILTSSKNQAAGLNPTDLLNHILD